MYNKKFVDLIGRRFNEWEVSKFVGKSKGGHSKWLCFCKCGSEKIVFGNSLVSGNSKSCGCLRRQKMIKNKNCLKHGMTKSSTYFIWKSMLDRCNNKDSQSYKWYGNRGIKVCKRWLKFENFLEDMGERPEEKSLDRIDNNLGYYKSNCKWDTVYHQSRNRRTNFDIVLNSKKYCLKDFLKIIKAIKKSGKIVNLKMSL